MPLEEAFAESLAALWARDGIAAGESTRLADAVARTFMSGSAGPREAAALLAESGVRAQWNRLLACDRAAALAARICPLAAEPLLDVLAGDGSVCEALWSLGLTRLAATERIDEYAACDITWRASRVPCVPFTSHLDLDAFGASSALLCAVLHHEPCPAQLLDALARTRIARWIVVENCVTPAFTPRFHELADRFFNTCLNDIGIHCGAEHRTLDEWVEQLSGYGQVTVVDPSFAVPGIPFPYSLMVVDR